MTPTPTVPTDTKPVGLDYRILCARFFTSIKAWYENPENKRRFEEWQKRRMQTQ